MALNKIGGKMSNQQTKILGEMPVGKAVMTIGIPAMASTLIMAIYNLVDTFFIGMLGSDRALSAVAVAFPIMALLGALGQVLGAGSAAAIGRAMGEKNNEYANRIAVTIIYTALIAGFAFMATGFLFMEPIFRIFGTTDSVMPIAKEYGGWMYVGAIFSIPNQTFNNQARAQARATLSMKALGLGAIANIILDPFFMFELGGYGLNMGIEGASLATTLAQAISFIYIGGYFFLGKTSADVKPKYFKPSKKIYSEVLKSGAPVAVTQILSTVAVSVTNIAAITYADNIIMGENIQSAYGIVLKVLTIIQSIVMGLILGYQPLASYAYGSKNKERFYECYYFIRKLMIFLTVPLSALLILFAPFVMGMFTQNVDIIEIGSVFIRANGATAIFVSLTILLTITFQATGNGKGGAIIASIRQGLLYVPLQFLFCMVGGIGFIYYAQPFSDLLTMFIGAYVFAKYKKQLNFYFDNVE